MRLHTRWGRRRRALATAVVVGLLATACGDSGGGGDDGTVELTIATFNDFGFQELYEQYMDEHPNITITEHVAEYQNHHTQLATRLAAGNGAADVVAIEGDFLGQFTAQPQNFHNLLDYGAGDLADRWLPWKWQQSMPDPAIQIGLGTDVGGLAICYRRDLFAQAGLPADRDEVAALWPDWQSYLETGQQFVAADTGARFLDSGPLLFNAILGQAPQAFYAPDGTAVVETNPAIRESWDLVMEAVESGLSANLVQYSTQWTTGLQQGTFATITCPAWMMAFIQSQATDTAGEWDVAAVPNGGGGNWGGSWLTVPSQSDHPQEAYDLAAWLTAPEQALTVFRAIGNMPSTVELYESPELTEFANPFFNEAPVGQIFTDAAKALDPQYQGPDSAAMRLAIQNGIRRVEDGQQAPDEAWETALREAVQAAD
jgi:cellobiose transport system substrate-binding protein